MIKIDKPSVVFKDHFEDCIKNKHEPLRTNLQNRFSLIDIATKEYDGRAKNCQLFCLASIILQLSPVSKEQLMGVYDNQMVQGPGREVYNKILISSNGVCSFCAHGTPKSLDHFLPKSEFPEYSIFPLNLIPCCSDCNHDKSEYVAKSEEKQYLHPYYDDVSALQWLECKILYSSNKSPAFEFFINSNAEGISDIIFNRLVFQFDSLKIGELYSKQAATELSGIGHFLHKHLKGESEVQSFLNEMAKSKSDANKNSWQAAMYRSMVNDDQFSKLTWRI
jgi:hypothetical protein